MHPLKYIVIVFPTLIPSHKSMVLQKYFSDFTTFLHCIVADFLMSDPIQLIVLSEPINLQ